MNPVIPWRTSEAPAQIQQYGLDDSRTQICAISHADRAWREETMKVAIRGNRITRTGKQTTHEDPSAAYFLMTASALATRRPEAVLGKKSTMPVICFARIYLFAKLATAEVAA